MARHKPVDDAADRLKQIRKEVAADLKVAVDSELCKHVSTLRLMRQNMQAKLLLGEHVNPDHLLSLDTAMRAYLPVQRLEDLTFHVDYISRHVCRECGEEMSADDQSPQPALPRYLYARPIDDEVAS